MENITREKMPVKRIAHLILFSSLIVTTVAAIIVHRTSRSSSASAPSDSGTIRHDSGPPNAQGVSFFTWPHRLTKSNTIHQRHYRHRRDILWDPHPSFALHLQTFDNSTSWATIHLEPVDDFWTAETQVHYVDDDWMAADRNASARLHGPEPGWHHLKGCFYQGVVEHDPHSKVVLSLCHGLTGHIRTSTGSYLIEPADNVDDQLGDSGAVRHVVYGLRPGTFHGDEPLTAPASSARSADDPSATGGRHGKRRSKRSLSQERFVEILVVADGKMVSYHGDNLVHYILTLMSVVSLIYKDASIGNPVHIAVVRMLLLKDQEFVLRQQQLQQQTNKKDKESDDDDGKEKGKSASEMLRNFCKWQRVFNDPDDSSSLHHDTALLITRENICRNPNLLKCDTLGLAELGTMCDGASSCSIVQDNGLSAAFTIAHELGHVLNMPHDDDFKCQRFIDTSGVHNVMSRMLDHNTYPWAWSNCSRYFITEFLDGGYGECLLDRPTIDLLDSHRSSKRLPGENFDENKQCEFVFGNGSKICPYMPSCKRLWCTTSGGEQEGCRTQHMPWADGTPCGRGRWCRHGSCVSKDTRSLEPVDGNWGPWQEWAMGTCSRPCGGGVQRSTRNCDSPAPVNGGTYCVGKRVRYRSCNIQECPPGSADFREEQCSFFNNNNFNIQGLPSDVVWVPKYTGINVKDRCRLYCRVEQSSAYYLLKDKVADGTTCGPDTDDICVNGICKAASCNHVLGRKEQLDICGVCGGDNSTCVIHNGTYNQTQYGYNLVTRIPAGSTNMDIRQKGYQGSNRDDNYLALMDAQTGEYLLNGNFVVSMFQKAIQFGGTTIEYSGSDAVLERLNSSKPIKRDLVVQVLSVGNLYPPDIHYQYVVSRDKHPPSPTFQWKLHDQWSSCNRICQGQQFRKPICVQIPGHHKVSEDYCASANQPAAESQPCNTHCFLRWRITHRSPCSAHCGEGVVNVTKQCEQDNPSIGISAAMEARHCKHLTGDAAVPDTEPCIGTCESAHWEFDPWTECSRSCNGGVQHRTAQCVDDFGNNLSDSNCQPEERIVSQVCNTHTCPKWEVGDWTPCSVSCGAGERLRPYWCQAETGHVVARSYCYPHRPPVHRESCYPAHCPMWYADEWGQCSVTCGSGHVERIVGCRLDNGTIVDPSACSGLERPASVQSCHLAECPTEPPTTLPPPTTSPVATTSLPATTSPPATTSLPATTSPPATTLPPATTTTQTPSTTAVPVTSTLTSAHEPSSTTELPASIAETETLPGFAPSVVEITTNVTSATTQALDNDLIDPYGNEIDGEWSRSSKSSERSENSFTRERGDERQTSETFVGIWRTGSWAPCSKSCGGGGRRMRSVLCYDLVASMEIDPSLCPEPAPATTEECGSDPCPIWIVKEWSLCSATCGKGIATRPVECQVLVGSTYVPSDLCSIQEKPSTEKNCFQMTCHAASGLGTAVSHSASVEHNHTSKTQWRTGSWGPCSKTCGGGFKRRQVVCHDEHQKESSQCVAAKRPQDTVHCNTDPCPTWASGHWNQCSQTCGGGTQTRAVTCRDHLGQTVPDHRCYIHERPEHSQECAPQPCPTVVTPPPEKMYRWKTSPWATCSKTCGKGVQHRPVYCVEADQPKIRVSEDYCLASNRTAQRPRSKRGCNKMSCPYDWQTGDWSECSHPCGPGIQHRRVACHRVNVYEWVDPEPVSFGCDDTQRPADLQPCNMGDCDALYRWKPSPWQQCSSSCGGEGFQKRTLACVSRSGSRVSRSFCPKEFRPIRKRRCQSKPCGFHSCAQVQRLLKQRTDGEYQLLVGGRNISIFCHLMNTSSPKEYLTLNHQDNYAEVYDKTLIKPDTCPHGGARKDSCECFHNRRASGITNFSKIRLNVTSLRVLSHDFTFARSQKGHQRVGYGEAGDCYSTANCPQGRFSINLQETGLRVSPHTSWAGHGHRASLWINRLDDNQKIQGKCGGYCGRCSPDPHAGLKLDPVAPADTPATT